MIPQIIKTTPDLLVCDEAHCLKNGGTLLSKAVSKIPAKSRLLLTGTPIQNDLLEFYSLINLANPGVLGDHEDFRVEYESPISKGGEADASPEEVEHAMKQSTALITVCNSFLLRRGEEFLKEYLPTKVEQVQSKVLIMEWNPVGKSKKSCKVLTMNYLFLAHAASVECTNSL